MAKVFFRMSVTHFSVTVRSALLTVMVFSLEGKFTEKPQLMIYKNKNNLKNIVSNLKISSLKNY